MNFVSVIISIFILGLLIALHELGHYLAAKAFGVYIFEYSLGFGPKLYQKRGKETKFTVRAIPIGGYVAMYGEEDALPDDAPHDLDPNRSLLNKKKWQRAIIMSAGIVINLIIALPIFMIGNALPYQAVDPDLRINVGENSVAATAGFLADDRIVAMRDGEDKPTIIGTSATGRAAVFGRVAITVDETTYPYHVVFFERSTKNTALENFFTLIADEFMLQINEGELTVNKAVSLSYPGFSADFTFDVTVFRGQYDDQGTVDESDDTMITTIISLPMRVTRSENSIKYSAIDPNVSLGISFKTIKVQRSFGAILKESGSDFTYSLTAVGKGIISLFTPRGLDNVGGIVVVFQQTTAAFTDFGFGPYLMIWGFISVNLALFNLLPFPGLDGWHLLVVIIESLTRKDLPKKFKTIASTVGVILLLALIVLITIRDIANLF
ncbi:MAG: M50 family metallopeptidase [Bacilli bacterium]|jgi:regulator of sigma E protease